jgi:hypothetical protein
MAVNRDNFTVNINMDMDYTIVLECLIALEGVIPAVLYGRARTPTSV